MAKCWARPSYMAPEQMRDAAKADIRADIFSLGPIAFYPVDWLTAFQGQPLFRIGAGLSIGRGPTAKPRAGGCIGRVGGCRWKDAGKGRPLSSFDNPAKSLRLCFHSASRPARLPPTVTMPLDSLSHRAGEANQDTPANKTAPHPSSQPASCSQGRRFFKPQHWRRLPRC